MSAQSLLSGILVVVMALSGLCGGFTSAGMEKPVTVELGVEVDGDFTALAQDGASAMAVIPYLQDLINAVGLRFSVDQSAAQMQVSLNGSPVANLSAAHDQEQAAWNVVSDLFPSTLLSVQDATIESLMGAEGSPLSMLEGIDSEALAAAAAVPVGELIASIQASAGEPETGSFSVNGTEYTTKIPYNITTKEIVTLVINTMKAVLSDENVASLISQISPDFSTEALDSTLEQITSAEEDTLPVLSAAQYTNEAADTCTEIVLTKDEEAISFICATAGSVVTVTVEALGQLNVVLTIDGDAKLLNLDASFAYNGMLLQIKGTLQAAEDRLDFAFGVSLPIGPESTVSATIKGAVTNDAPVFDAGADKTAVQLEAMMSDPELAESFTNEIMEALQNVLQNVMMQFPGLMELMTDGASVEEAVPVE